MSKLFNTPPLTFEEFITPKKTGFPTYNNFFFNLYNYYPGESKNYERLKLIDQELADLLSTIYTTFVMESKKIPYDVIKKGYEAYLMLRDNLKDDLLLAEEIHQYNKEKREPSSDDWCTFFA